MRPSTVSLHLKSERKYQTVQMFVRVSLSVHIYGMTRYGRDFTVISLAAPAYYFPW